VAWSNDRNLPPLDFWPTTLKWQATTLLTILYTGSAVGILALWLKAGSDGQYRLSSENVRMISRYFPSALGTVNVVLFRQVVREFIRMKPFVAMADQGGKTRSGALPWKSVSGAFFPWQDVSITPGASSFFSLFCQFAASFIVSLKVALLASDETDTGWILTVRFWPAFFLIIGHVVMAVYILWVAWVHRGKSTGLRWDPITIADYCSLFAQCNVAGYFAPLELQHDMSAKKLMSEDHRFRLGYWEKEVPGSPQPKIVYGIGTTWDAEGISAKLLV